MPPKKRKASTLKPPANKGVRKGPFPDGEALAWKRLPDKDAYMALREKGFSKHASAAISVANSKKQFHETPQDLADQKAKQGERKVVKKKTK